VYLYLLLAASFNVDDRGYFAMRFLSLVEGDVVIDTFGAQRVQAWQCGAEVCVVFSGVGLAMKAGHF
jgi:hypothetical protein